MRVGIEIVSDILLRYKSDATRWISELITDLGSKGFTMLAVIDPLMHPTDQLHSVLNLFDGEISIMQSVDPIDCEKSILVKKLRNQDYIKKPICLTEKIVINPHFFLFLCGVGGCGKERGGRSVEKKRLVEKRNNVNGNSNMKECLGLG